MAFLLSNWSKVVAAMNTGASDGNGSLATPVGGPNMFTYQNTLDGAAGIAAPDYFAEVIYELSIGDFIFANGAALSFSLLRVTTVDREAGTVTTTAMSLP